ncbi:MAG: helix-turn-helix domain-containing protein [Alphaproteobacteria bacterium]
MTKDNATFILSQNIRKFRKAKKMTQAELAKRINKTVEMVCQLENGVSGTKISTLSEIAEVLGVEVYQLFLEAPLLTIEDLSPELVEIMQELQDQNELFVRALLQLVKAPKD